MAQGAVAALVALGVGLLAGGAPTEPSPILAWILVALAVGQLPLVLGITMRFGAMKGGAGARRGALSTALLAGVMLASTAWFLALALATGQAGAPLFLLLFLTMLAYTVGFALMGRLARVAATEKFETEGDEPDAAPQ